MDAVARFSPNLESLTISSSKSTYYEHGYDFEALCKWAKLVQFGLYGADLSSEACSKLFSCLSTTVTDFAIELGNPELGRHVPTPEVLRELHERPNLTSLTFEATSLQSMLYQSEALSHLLEQLEALRSLTIRAVPFSVIPALMKSVTTLTRLESLSLGRVKQAHRSVRFCVVTLFVIDSVSLYPSLCLRIHFSLPPTLSISLTAHICHLTCTLYHRSCHTECIRPST